MTIKNHSAVKFSIIESSYLSRRLTAIIEIGFIGDAWVDNKCKMGIRLNFKRKIIVNTQFLKLNVSYYPSFKKYNQLPK